MSRDAKLDDKNLQWLAAEAEQTSRSWEALANDQLARTTDGKEQVAALKARAAANGQKLSKVGLDQYSVADIENDDGSCVMPLSCVGQHLDLIEGKLY